MNIIFFDDETVRGNLLPLAFTRPIAEFRVGILTIREKWMQVVNSDVFYLTADYLSEKYPMAPADEVGLFIAGHVCPSQSYKFFSWILSLDEGDALFCGDTLIAFCGKLEQFRAGKFKRKNEVGEPLTIIRNLYDIFTFNGEEILRDFPIVTGQSPALPIEEFETLSPTNRIIGPERDEKGHPMVFLAKGAKAECAIFNTTHGPIYIGPDAEVMEGSCLRGPVALCDHGVIKMGTKVYPDTTIGPWCKVGGELSNVVFFGYSNKAHDGFLGNAVIGEWCNLGAGCVASNLKNNYSEIRLWNYPARRFLHTGLQFCGLIMGDHSKAGINVMFNTATVVGVGSSVYGAGFPRTFIPSFQEGGAAGFTDMPLAKFYDIATRVMARRHCELTPADRAIFAHLHSEAQF